MKKNIIFICIHNSARSQMAEAYMKYFHQKDFNCYSAGLEQGKLNPIVVDAMLMDNIDISQNRSEIIDKYLNSNINFDYIVTVCDQASAQKCPYFPGNGKRIHFGFEDPSSLNGTYKENLKNTILIRDKIKNKVKTLEIINDK